MPSRVGSKSIYVTCEELIATDKNQALGNYPKIQEDLSKIQKVSSDTEYQIKLLTIGSQAARIAVIALAQILTLGATIAISSAPLLISAFIVLSPLGSLLVGLVCIAIAIALQVVAQLFIIHRKNLDNLCTSMGIDEIDNKAHHLHQELIHINEQKIDTERRLAFSKLEAQSMWKVKQPSWDAVSALKSKDPENSIFTRALPAEIMAQIAEYVLYTPISNARPAI